MAEVGIRALKQNASAVVAAAAAGESVTITEHGRPVAQLVPIARTRVRALIESGRARAAHRSLADMPPPEPGPELSVALRDARDAERY